MIQNNFQNVWDELKIPHDAIFRCYQIITIVQFPYVSGGEKLSEAIQRSGYRTVDVCGFPGVVLQAPEYPCIDVYGERKHPVYTTKVEISKEKATLISVSSSLNTLEYCLLFISGVHSVEGTGKLVFQGNINNFVYLLAEGDTCTIFCDTTHSLKSYSYHKSKLTNTFSRSFSSPFTKN